MKEQGPKTPKSNVLSAKDFEKEPKVLKPYAIGDTVTRENFINLFIQSFAISRGKGPVQIMFFRWLKQKYNFDYKKTFKVFSDCGGLDGLSKLEKDAFDKAFEAVGRHAQYASEKLVDLKDPKVRKFEFDYNITNLIHENLGDDEKAAKRIFNIPNIKEYSDFQKAAEQFFNEVPPASSMDSEYAL